MLLDHRKLSIDNIRVVQKCAAQMPVVTEVHWWFAWQEWAHVSVSCLLRLSECSITVFYREQKVSLKNNQENHITSEFCVD